MRIFRYTAFQLLWSAGISAVPFTDSSNDHFSPFPEFSNGTVNNLWSEPEGLIKRGLSNDVKLRILPLGASIVWGWGSTDGNGFRYPLRNRLVWGGNSVNMVGSVQTGTMADNNCECWGSHSIDEISARADNSIPSQPNLVLIHVGSVDMGRPIDPSTAHIRLGNLIDKLFDAIPGVTIVASTLLPLEAHQAEANLYNSNIPGMVSTRQKAGKKLVLADMSSSFFSYADEVDGQHPNDYGYQKMAAVFYQAIKAASDKGWLTEPKDTGIPDVVEGGNNLCDKDINHGAIGPYQIQAQVGRSDGDYVHRTAAAGSYIGKGNPSADGLFWADINGDGIDDYVYVSANLLQGLGVALSLGGGKFGEYLRVTTFPANCDRANVRFAEINGDGRCDICCLDTNGDLRCWLNKAGSDTRTPEWEATGTSDGYLIKQSGFTGAQVRLADIDGDGRSDYVAINADTGSIYGYRNMAPGYDPPTRWLQFHGIATGLPTGLSLKGWRFADLNGDHRDDLLHVNDHGEVTTWINQRGLKTGTLAPSWISMGTHGGDATKPINVTFGKFMGTGRADYSVVSAISTGDVQALFYENLGSGGTAVRGDGTRYCDMTGDGKDDLIWISLMGEISIWGNVHQFGEFPPLTAYGVVLDVGRTRREVYFADFDGDKRCDILLVDKLTGRTTMLRNDFANGKFAFTDIGVVTGSATCTTQYGFDLHDNGVRWHDIDGDGRADFLCFKKNGVLSGYLNKGINNMVNQGMIKHAEGRERKNLRIADINGDGRDDLLWVDIVNSAVQAWHNEGPSGDAPGDEALGTSAFRWSLKGYVASGSEGRGSCIEFANINGLGRADYILVYPVTNRAFAMFNICANGGIAPVEPHLPDPPAMKFPIPGSGTTPIPDECDYLCEHSSCREMEQTKDTVAQEWYDFVKAGDYFKAWLKEGGDHTTSMVRAFAYPLGIGESFTCSIEQPCGTPSCTSLGDESEEAPDSAAQLLILMSISHLSQFLGKFYSALSLSQESFNTLQTALVKDFWPHPDPGDIVMQHIINAIYGAVGIAASLIGGPTTIASVGIFQTLSLHLSLALGASSQTLDDLATNANAAKKYFDTARTSIITAHNTLMTTGSYEKIPITDLFEHGAYVDATELPILNSAIDSTKRSITLDQLSTIYEKQLFAGLVNRAWKANGAYLMSFPMTEYEFDNLVVKAGSDDRRLKGWYRGFGWYFQSYSMHGGLGPPYPFNDSPQGWGELPNYGMTTYDVIVSSAEAWFDGEAGPEGGYMYTASNHGEAYIDYSTERVDMYLNNGPRLPGTFSLPNCPVARTDDFGLEDFADLLQGDNEQPIPPEFYEYASYCSCQFFVDRKFNKFSDIYPGNGDAEDFWDACY